MAARITTDGMWRVSYGELPGLNFEELKGRQPMKFRTMLPGNPAPEDYRMVNFSPYKIHQRLAESMRVGRFLLAADAAHCMSLSFPLGLRRFSHMTDVDEKSMQSIWWFRPYRRYC